MFIESNSRLEIDEEKDLTFEIEKRLNYNKLYSLNLNDHIRSKFFEVEEILKKLPTTGIYSQGLKKKKKKKVV